MCGCAARRGGVSSVWSRRSGVRGEVGWGVWVRGEMGCAGADTRRGGVGCVGARRGGVCGCVCADESGLEGVVTVERAVRSNGF